MAEAVRHAWFPFILWCKTISSSSTCTLPIIERFSPAVLRFFSLHKIISKFQFDQDSGPARKQVRTDVASLSKYIIYLFILSNPSYLSNKIAAVFFMFFFSNSFSPWRRTEGNITLKETLLHVSIYIFEALFNKLVFRSTFHKLGKESRYLKYWTFALN